nr:spermidine/putrescine import ATP-binding protein PotA 2 [Agromyces mediolanus]
MESETRTAAAPPQADAVGGVVLDRVSKRYGGQAAVDDLSLEIRPGEFLSLLGPSGCGKTTTLRMIAGFEHPDAGDIRISGRSVIGQAPYRRDVNTVFQAYALFPHMTVAQNVAYGLHERRVARVELRARVAEALAMVQMRRFADRKPSQLSGGQQQRVALARALVNRPAVLLLDEPLAALDRKLREEMQLELKLIQAKLGLTFVFVTHDQAEALSMSDRIAVMRDGRIEQLDDATTIYRAPVSAYVASFVGQQNFFSGVVSAVGGEVQTSYGPISTVSTGLSVGQRVRAAVRPEFVELATGSPPGDTNRVEGRLIGVSHLGEAQQYLVQLGPELSVIARVATPLAPKLQIGESVWCSWRAESVQLFPDDEPIATGSLSAPTTTAIPAQ